MAQSKFGAVAHPGLGGSAIELFIKLELSYTMLDAAIETVTESRDQPVVHSDRGGHYPAGQAGYQE